MECRGLRVYNKKYTAFKTDLCACRRLYGAQAAGDGRRPGIMEFDWFSWSIIALIAGSFIYAMIYIARVKRYGTEAEAYVSRLEEHESIDADGACSTYYDVYVIYRTQEGRQVEGTLSNPKNRLKEGDRLLIRYLPGKENIPVLTRILD